jgi:hypothetical protein
MILMIMATLLFAVLIVIARQVTAAFTGGGGPTFWIWLGLLVVVATAGIYALFFDPWGDRLRQRIADAIYGAEGRVTLIHPRTPGWRTAGFIAGLTFCVCLVATALLTAHGTIPRTHVQMWSALYMVPFLTFLVLWQRPVIGWRWGLLWPALYGLHALAMALGAPIVFTGQWKFLSMVIPLLGYGLLAGLVGHLHSRSLLRRIRALAGADFAVGGEEGAP